MIEGPVWLTLEQIRNIHTSLIRAYGGSYGVRDEGLIESALARPHQKWAYQSDLVDLPALGASYALGLVKNHGFVDGNKRVAFAASASFLLANGLLLIAPEPDAYVVMVDLASGVLSEDDMARWLHASVEPTG
jgi:death-on-curing protein